MFCCVPCDQAALFRAPRPPPWCYWHLASHNHLRGMLGAAGARLWNCGQWLFCKEGGLHGNVAPGPGWETQLLFQACR